MPELPTILSLYFEFNGETLKKNSNFVRSITVSLSHKLGGYGRTGGTNITSGFLLM